MTESVTLANLRADPSSAEPAIIVEATEVVISYRELTRQVEHLADELSRTGLQPGDVIEAEIEGIGILHNIVID